MLRVLFAVSTLALFAGAASWATAALRLRRHRLEHPGDDDRSANLASRDALVAALFTIVGIASAAHAAEGGVTTGADWILLAAVAVVAASLPFLGRFQGTTELARDQRSEVEHLRLEVLYEIAAAGEELDVDVSSQRMASALVPTVGDWAIVVLLDREGAIEAMGVAVGDDDHQLLVDLLERYPVALDVDEGMGRALRSGEQVRYDDITQDLLRSVAEDDQHLELLKQLGLHSAVIEPLIAREQRLGAIAVMGRNDRELGSDVDSLLRDVAEQAAPILDNARLHRDLLATERELRLREEILRAQGESGVEGLLVVSPEGRMVSYNSRFAEMWDFDEELLARGSDEEALAAGLDHVVDRDAFIERIRSIYADPTTPSRDEIQFRDGRVFDRYGAPLVSDDSSFLGWAWYFRDITDERRAQQSLVESTERFAALARTLQESLLPPALPGIPGLELAARYHPAGDGSEVGGDFYDVFQVDEHHWCAVMGDVCGKGASAARLTALARYTLRASVARSPKLERNLSELNAALLREAERDRERNEHRFVTAAALRFRTVDHGVEVTAGSAGHPPPLLLRADGTVSELGCRGSLLGMFADVRFSLDDIVLREGDLLVLYTDGVTEARRGTEEYGDDRLRALLAAHAGATAAELTEAIEAAVLDFQNGTARDDIAVMVVRANEPTTGSPTDAELR